MDTHTLVTIAIIIITTRGSRIWLGGLCFLPTPYFLLVLTLNDYISLDLSEMFLKATTSLKMGL